MTTMTTTTTNPNPPTLSNPGSTVLPPTKLSHLLLLTTPTQFPEMRDFYKSFLSTRATYEDSTVSLQTYDEEDHRIGIVSRPYISLAPRGKFGGLHHVSFTHASAEEFAIAYLQRKNLGYEPVWCVNHGPTVSLMYRDPDGNLVETQVEVFGTKKERDGFYESEEFKKNPVGVEFDPEEMVRRLREGEDWGEVLRRDEGGRVAVPPE